VLFSQKENATHGSRWLLYMDSESLLGDSRLIRRGSVPMRKRKDVLAVLPLKRNNDAGKYNEDLLNAGRG